MNTKSTPRGFRLQNIHKSFINSKMKFMIFSESEQLETTLENTFQPAKYTQKL
jgi:hypothetical protein